MGRVCRANTVVIICMAWALLCLGGCATQLGVATTSFDVNYYKHSKIGLMPLVVNPSYSSVGLPTDAIANTVSKVFSSFGVRMGARPLIVAGAKAENPSYGSNFPYTPKRLADLGAALGFDAALGISVLAWNDADPHTKRRASIQLLFTFVDSHSPDLRRWVLVGEWSADSAEDLPDKIYESLGFDLIKVKWLARAGLIPGGDTEVFRIDQPLIALSGSAMTLRSGMIVTEKSLELTVTALNESGLHSLMIANEKGKFSGSIFAEVVGSDKPLPNFLSAPVTIPLANGKNNVVAVATGAGGSESRRELKVQCDCSPKLHIGIIGIEKYKNFVDPPGLSVAIAAVREASKKNMNVLLAENIGMAPTRYDVTRLMDLTAEAAGPDDPILLFVAGRVGYGESPKPPGNASGTEAFLQLADTALAYPGLGSLPLQNLIGNINSTRVSILLDVCTDTRDLESVRGDMPRLLRSGSAAVVSDCAEGVGNLSKVVSTWLKITPNPVPISSELELLDMIRRRIPTATSGPLLVEGIK